MSSTPLWLPLASAGIAVLGTLGGVLITQRQADRREDKARTFEYRREVYADFYKALQAMARLAYLHGIELNEDPPDDWYSEAFGELSRLSLYADRRVARAASAAYEAAWYWGMNSKQSEQREAHVDDMLEVFNKGWGEYQDAERELLMLIREALSIPEGDLTLPPPISIASPDGFFPDMTGYATWGPATGD
jgi:hypothetical protein